MVAGNDIIIFAGQSNMVGRGTGTFVDTSSVNDSKIFQVGRTSPYDMTIIPATRPFHYWPSTQYHSFDLSFARMYAAKFLASDRNLICVPAADGGSSILLWLGLISGLPLYSDMIARVNLCLGQTGYNKVVGWFEQQGEKDIVYAVTPSDPNHSAMPDAATYKARKLDLIDKVRGDLGSFPMSFGLFTDDWMPDGTTASLQVKEAFGQAIREAAFARWGCKAIDTEGLAVETDTLHFTAQGQEILAARHFTAYASTRKV